MRQVIVQIVGVGAFRAPATVIADTLEINRPEDIYLIDPNGHRWAPTADSWILLDYATHG